MPKWIHVLKPGEIHRVTEQDSIFTLPNKYGYQININHPAVNKAYTEYKAEIGELLFPITSDQRFEFEKRVLTGYYPELKSYLERDRK